MLEKRKRSCIPIHVRKGYILSKATDVDLVPGYFNMECAQYSLPNFGCRSECRYNRPEEGRLRGCRRGAQRRGRVRAGWGIDRTAVACQFGQEDK